MGQRDLTVAIREATSITECDALAADISAERVELVVLHFGELHRRRAQLLEARATRAQVTAHDVAAGLLFSSLHAHGEHQRVLPDAGSNGVDPLNRWRAVDSDVYPRILDLSWEPSAPPPVRALLQQALWELRRLWRPFGDPQIRPVDVLAFAVATHLAAARWVLDRHDEPNIKGMYCVQHWKTAAYLSSSVGKPSFVTGHLNDLRDAQQRLHPSPHWAAALFEVEVELATHRGQRAADVITDERLENILAGLSELEQALEAEYVAQHVLHVREQAERLLGRPPDQQEVWRRRATLLERAASLHASGLVASLKWKEAASAYHQAGMRNDAARAKNAAREAIQRSYDEDEVTTISVPVPFDRRDHEAALAPFLQGATQAATVLRRMASCLFAPSLDAGTSPNRGARSLFSLIGTTVPLVGDRSLAEIAPGTDEAALFEQRQRLLREIALQSTVIVSELLRRVRVELDLDAEDLVAHIASSPFTESDDLPFIRAAAQAYVRGDLIATMHTLVPRLEQIIRRILRVGGVEITALRDGELRERPLGELLRAADGVLDPPLITLLQAVLPEEWGMNLRNRIAHGLATPDDCSQATTDRVVQIALYLGALRPADSTEPRQSSSAP